METIGSSDLKTILHSKRSNIYYLQYCRVLVNGGRVEYVTEEGKRSLYWNIPIANTTVVMLGTGTSVTQAAMREFARAGVLIGFCGGGGTPLYAANEVEVDVSWLSSQSEYRPTEYLQHWVSFWFDAQLRLSAAIAFQQVRIDQIRRAWLGNKMQREDNFSIDAARFTGILERFEKGLSSCSNSSDLLSLEAVMTKALYKLAAETVNYGDFIRAKRGGGIDRANRFLDHGNYLAYGLAAVACWVLGLPHGLAVLHGKTRRGGLVFDVADMIKDALILPQAFIAAMAGEEEQAFRQRCLNSLQNAGALDTMIESLESVAQRLTRAEK